MTLGDVVYRFKSLTTTRYREGVKNNDWPPFPGKLWQRNYYEHIIRSSTALRVFDREKMLNRIREYIAANPQRWEFDGENLGGRVDAVEKDFWKTFGTVK